MKISEEEKKSLEKLIELVRENPDLPIIPMVDGEVVPDDSCMQWMGSWGDCCIDHYIIAKERVYFLDDDEEEILAALHGQEWVEEATDDEWNAAYENVPWITAIIVHIEPTKNEG